MATHAAPNRIPFTHLKRIGIFKRFAFGCCMSVFFVFLAIVVPLWPVTLPLFLFLALGAPFAFLGYRADGHCPACGSHLEVTKRSGGLRCRGCRSPLRIAGNRLYRVI